MTVADTAQRPKVARHAGALARLAPCHVVITGASAGIGRALALAYAGPGVVLGLAGRDAQRLAGVVAACQAKGAEVVSGQFDVCDAGRASAWVEQFDAQYPVDLLIANAGVASTLSGAHDWEGRERTARIVDTNFYGALNVALPVIERMRARKRGQIALVASLQALRGMALAPAYSASKAAIKAYADAVRPLLKRDGIALSTVLPGFVKTAMSDAFPGDKPFMWSPEKAAAHIRAKLARRRAEIAFPFLLALGLRALCVLPAGLADAILGALYPVRDEGR